MNVKTVFGIASRLDYFASLAMTHSTEEIASVDYLGYNRSLLSRDDLFWWGTVQGPHPTLSITIIFCRHSNADLLGDFSYFVRMAIPTYLVTFHILAGWQSRPTFLMLLGWKAQPTMKNLGVAILNKQTYIEKTSLKRLQINLQAPIQMIFKIKVTLNRLDHLN